MYVCAGDRSCALLRRRGGGTRPVCFFKCVYMYFLKCVYVCMCWGQIMRVAAETRGWYTTCVYACMCMYVLGTDHARCEREERVVHKLCFKCMYMYVCVCVCGGGGGGGGSV